MTSTLDTIEFTNPHIGRCHTIYQLPTSTQLSPGSDSSESSQDSSQSAESVASSQTDYSSRSQDEQWSLPEVQTDDIEPVGKTICLPTERHVSPEHVQQHARRTTREVQPPSLVRQHERKGQFVFHLVDSATYLVETIWPTAAPVCHSGMDQYTSSTLPLRTFIEETLRRSKTSFSTLQVALFYLILLKDHVPSYTFTMEQQQDCPLARSLQCGRRMFLAALILGSKYLQDRNYSARAWSKISGLRVCEINLNERALLAAVNWTLHIPEPTFNCWQDILVKYSNPSMVHQWRRAIRSITPEYVANYRTAPVTQEASTPPYSWSGHQSPSVNQMEKPWNGCSPSPTVASPGGLGPRCVMQPSVAATAFKLTTPSPMLPFCPTPAVSSAGDTLRSRPRGAMCGAMSMVSGAATARSCVDLAPSITGFNTFNGPCNRRSSLASTTSRSSSSEYCSSSVVSSPASMISDNGSSRSSSISDISPISRYNSPIRNRLPRIATQNALHKMRDYNTSSTAFLDNSDDGVTVLDSEPLNVHNFTASPEVMSIEDDATPTQRALESVRDSRKRHRTSVDLVASTGSALQDQVRKQLRQTLHAPENIRSMPAFGIKQKNNTLDAGTPAAKKPCYMDEVQGRMSMVRPVRVGPGMWGHILEEM